MQQDTNDGGDVVPTIEKYEDVQLVFEVVFLSVSQKGKMDLTMDEAASPLRLKYITRMRLCCTEPAAFITGPHRLGLACVPELVVVNGHISDTFRKEISYRYCRHEPPALSQSHYVDERIPKQLLR
jgi:hypothetical protein